MVTKKSAQANLEDKKSFYLLMGFIMALSFVFIVIEWSGNTINIYQPDNQSASIDDYDLPPVTMPENIQTPPPPPTPIAEIINVVDDQTPIATTNIITDATPINDIQMLTDNKFDVAPEENNEIHVYVPEMPQFNGDVNSYLSNNIKYPQIPLENEIQGRVVCQFVVNKDGSIVDIQVVKSIDRYLDAEAVRVIKSMPNWKPGKMNGKAVRVKYTLPIMFKLM